MEQVILLSLLFNAHTHTHIHLYSTHTHTHTHTHLLFTFDVEQDRAMTANKEIALEKRIADLMVTKKKSAFFYFQKTALSDLLPFSARERIAVLMASVLMAKKISAPVYLLRDLMCPSILTTRFHCLCSHESFTRFSTHTHTHIDYAI